MGRPVQKDIEAGNTPTITITAERLTPGDILISTNARLPRRRGVQYEWLVLAVEPVPGKGVIASVAQDEMKPSHILAFGQGEQVRVLTWSHTYLAAIDARYAAALKWAVA